MGVIYMTTNLVNGKKYIGRDKYNRKRYLGSGKLLKKAIKRYGKNSFRKEILEECVSDEELKTREEYWLKYYDVANNRDFYNLHNNSSGGSMGGERNPMFGRTGQKSPRYGKKHSDETRKKMSESKKGLPGKKHSDESKRKIGDAVRGEKSPMFGTKFSKETRQKMSDSSKGKPKSESHKKNMRESAHKGETNSQFKGYILCVDGTYKGQRKTAKEWSDTLSIYIQYIYTHLNGKKFKNGINGNFFKWEHELQS